MSNKSKTRNKVFKTVKAKLEYIQKECNEPELFEDLKQLFKNKNFQNVKITHGNKEFGKDLVFSKPSESFNDTKWYAAIVKNKSASQNDFLQGHEIGDQINLALKVKHIQIDGSEKGIAGLFIIINGKVSDNATKVIAEYIHPMIMEHIEIWDYQDLEREISAHSKESFLDNLEPTLNVYIKEQIKVLSDISTSSKIYDLKIDDINEIFINVQTTYSKELRKINEYVSFDNEKDKYKEEDIEGSNEILNSNKNFIIHGIPTSGKTLFLKRIGIKALSTDNVKPDAVFYFDLQNFKTSDFDILRMINEQYSVLTGGDIFLQEDFGKKILLFDSIDFINEEKSKIAILEKLEAFIESNAIENLQVVIAIRNLEFARTKNLLNKFEETELLPFNFNQALKLVKKIIPNDEQKTNSFLKALQNSLLDTSIQRTPLALTLMAILYRDDKVDLKELPANIFELYNRFTDVYLDKWDVSHGVTQFYKYEQTKNIIAFIAYHLHANGLNSISCDELRHFLEALRQQFNYEELDDIDNFILHLKSKNGVFYFDNNSGEFMFFNHFFQEYFASLCIEDDDDSILIDNFFNTWWSNALIFYCGKKPKSFKLHNAILNKIVPVGSFQKLVYLNQHSKCLQASHAISIANRTDIVRKMIFEYDQMFNALVEETKNPDSVLNNVPFVNIINQSKSIFEGTFNSKHISTKETIQLFEEVLLDDQNQLNNITLYNIAYYLSFHQNSPNPLAIFEEKIKDDVVWNRILYVDINFLNLKKKLDDKKFARIKKKMNKNKFLIQHILNSSILTKAKLLEN